MSETYDFEGNDHSWFNHLILESDGEDVSRLVNSEGYDSSRMEVCLKINGMPLRICDFNEVLNEWSDRIESSIREELHEKYRVLSREHSKEEEAEELITKKIGKLNEVLIMLEDIDLDEYNNEEHTNE